MLTVEQMLNAQKTNVEILFGLGGKAFEGVEKLIELNVQTAKTAMAEAADAARAAMSTTNAQELVALQAGLLQPSAEKAVAYGRHVYEIAAATNAEVTKVAEATAADVQSKFLTVVDSAVKNAPAGSENVVAFVRSAVANASNVYDGVQKAAKQAAGVAEANIEAMSSTAIRASQGAAKAKRAA